MNNEYYLGLDVGTNSVGWCLTNQNYDVVRVKGKRLWGVRLFEESKSAKDRRGFRSQRRRLQRRKNRINLLREIFASEINKVDPTFFQRLDESFFDYDDRTNKNKTTLFIDKNFTDKDFFAKFPTIYHLRKYLMESTKKEDIRFIYLALSNIVKNRGHFLIEKFDVNNVLNKEEIELNLKEINEKFKKYNDYNDIEVNENIIDELKVAFSIKTKRNRKTKISEIFENISNKALKDIVSILLSGSEIKAKNIETLSKTLEDLEIDDDFFESEIFSSENFIGSFSSDENFEEKCLNLVDKLPEFSDLFLGIIELKKIYDAFTLDKFLSGTCSISEAMIRRFDEYKKDLVSLKTYVKDYFPNLKEKIFEDTTLENNYVAYTGFNIKNHIRVNKANGLKTCDQAKLFSFLKKELDLEKKEHEDDPNYRRIKQGIESGEFLKKLKNKENGFFPYQLHKFELIKILDSQRKYWSFLDEIDSEGFSNYEKIISIFKFKVPYFVGPLIFSNDEEKRKFAWAKLIDSNKHTKIYPRNFSKVVDLDSTAEEFITRMQNKCTYLHDEYCLPKSSIILSYFNVLNFLNTLSINGSRDTLKIDDRNEIIKNLFLKKKNVNWKDIKNYFNNKYSCEVEIDKEEKSSINVNMNSYIVLANIFGDNYIKDNIDLIEDLIKDITIFEDKKILENRLRTIYKFDDEIINKIKAIKFKDFGRLSKKLLVGIKDSKNKSILNYMIDEKLEFNEILNQFEFNDLINDYNNKNFKSSENVDDFIEDLYIPKMAHRAIKQVYLIIKEIQKIIGNRKISKYFIEFTRSNKDKNKGKNSTSRYDSIKELLDSCKEEEFKEIKEKFKKEIEPDKDKLKSEKYFLYFAQLGKSLYSGEKVDFDDLKNGDLYDVDHIYPRALVKDDSLLNNKVLVEKSLNNLKGDTYPIDTSILWKNKGGVKEAYKFFDFLHKRDKKFMNSEKLSRLKKQDFNETELDHFVNRQKVITDQSTMGIVCLLKDFLHVDKENIVYSKGENVSTFRNTYELIKSRTANNFHHAHDAYLNIVVANIFDKYFKGRFIKNYSDLKYFKEKSISANVDYLMKKDYLYDHNGEVIWDKNEQLNKIKKYLYHTNDIMVTERCYVGTALFSKSSMVRGTKVIPLKKGMPFDKEKGDAFKYGGYSDPSYNFYSLIEIENKKGQKEAFLVANSDLLPVKEGKYLIKKLKINTVIEDGDLKYSISGKSANTYLLKNKAERFFSYENLKIIKKIDKFIEKVSNNKTMNIEDTNSLDADFKISDNEICIYKTRLGEVLTLSEGEIYVLYDSIIDIFGKRIYSFSVVKKIKDLLLSKREFFRGLPIYKKIFIISQLLNLLKTNERKTANLKYLESSENSGVLTVNQKMHSGQRIVYESVTGFYKKVIWDYDKWHSGLSQ